MNIINSIKILTEFSKAVDVGEEIKDPAEWKNKQVLMNKVGIILVALTSIVKAAGIEIPETSVPLDTMISYASEFLVGAMMFANIIITWATSKKVGKNVSK